MDDVTEQQGAGGEAKASSSRESSASNHNESSTLLASRELQMSDASGRSAKETRRGRRRHSARSSRRSQDSSTGPGDASASPSKAAEVSSSVALVQAMLDKERQHMAESHDDTSEGAVHYFHDEEGKYLPTPCKHRTSAALSHSHVSSRRKPLSVHVRRIEHRHGGARCVCAPPASPAASLERRDSEFRAREAEGESVGSELRRFGGRRPSSTSVAGQRLGPGRAAAS